MGFECGEAMSSTERYESHRRSDTIDNERLEFRSAGEIVGSAGLIFRQREIRPQTGVFAECGHPGTTAVVILTPGDRMKAAVTRMDGLLGGQRALIDGCKELDAGGVGYERVETIGDREARSRGTDGCGRRVARFDLHRARLRGGRVVGAGLAE